MDQHDPSNSQPPQDDALQTLDDQHNEEAPAIFSEHLHIFREAVERLFIIGNQSGRNHFRQKYFQAALFLFGPALMDYDASGTPDFEFREKLERQAEARRIELLNILQNINDISVQKGALNVEYVHQVVDYVGMKTAEFIYADRVIDMIKKRAQSQ